MILCEDPHVPRFKLVWMRGVTKKYRGGLQCHRLRDVRRTARVRDLHSGASILLLGFAEQVVQASSLAGVP